MTNDQGVGHPVLIPGWQTEWETYRSADHSVQLFSLTVHKDSWKQGKALVILHGHGEHGGRYLRLASDLGHHVDALVLPDHRGHGRSEGLRGHIESFDSLVDDAALTIRKLEAALIQKFGRAEIHLLGHSLGGLVALRALFLKPDLPLLSAVISAPLLGIKAKVPMVKRAASLVLEKLWGSLQLSTELDAKAISRDPEQVRAYREDRLVHDKMTPRFFEEMGRAMEDTRKRTGGIRIPLLFIVPLRDQIADPEATLSFYEKLRSGEKKLKRLEEGFHEPLNDLDREDVIREIGYFIRDHSKGAVTK